MRYHNAERRTRLLLVTCACCAGCTAVYAQAEGGEAAITAVLVVSGFDRPLYVTHAPNDPNRIFVVEQRGVIRIVDISQDPPVALATPFLDIRARVDCCGESGLLGLAFHPEFQSKGYFYVNYINRTDLATTISRFEATAGQPNDADETSEVVLLTIDQPSGFHNGGWIAFGPDGMLYIATGNGGGGYTPVTGNAQDTTDNLLGKILRIDVDGSNAPSGTYGIPPDNPFVGVNGDDEIWSYGLRNPWRNSFDPVTGDLYIADVGAGSWEEISVQPGSSTGGENWGWWCREGAHDFNLSNPACATANLLDPIHEYSHGFGRCSITGGEVYRGRAMSQLHGTYFFADVCSAQIWSLRYDGAVSALQERTLELASGGASITFITSFGRDVEGEIYICSFGNFDIPSDGKIFKIVPVPLTLLAFAEFQRCFGEDDVQAAPQCVPFDYDLDTDIDLDDYRFFHNAIGAPRGK